MIADELIEEAATLIETVAKPPADSHRKCECAWCRWWRKYAEWKRRKEGG